MKIDLKNITFTDKIKRTIGFCEKPQLKKLLDTGKERIEKHLDLLNIMKKINHNHKHGPVLTSQYFNDESIIIDSDENE